MEMLKQKLSSRKLWAAVAAAVLCVVTAVMGESMNAEAAQLTQYAVNAMVAYIFGETAVDIFRQISDALKEKYKLPDIGEILDEIEKAGTEGESDGAEAAGSAEDPQG